MTYVAVNDWSCVRLIKEIVVAQYCMADGFRARLVACRDVEEAARNVADSEKSIRKEPISMKVRKTRQDGGAPVGPISLELEMVYQWAYQS